MRGRQVLDLLLMISFCFGEVGGLGLEFFDAGVETVDDVRFLVGTRHGDGSIGRAIWMDEGSLRGKCLRGNRQGIARDGSEFCPQPRHFSLEAAS